MVVTGGGCFIGRHLTRRLALSGVRDLSIFDLPVDESHPLPALKAVN
jgi:hypothetical protein